MGKFGMEQDRMETDGKGASQPIDRNDTPVGKANNRRVEFIKR
jgi:OmpA-OmpF porin, OOP family